MTEKNIKELKIERLKKQLKTVELEILAFQAKLYYLENWKKEILDKLEKFEVCPYSK